MINVYVNYPNARLTVHTKLSCAEIGKMKKPGQRAETITEASFSTMVPKLASKSFQFGANAPLNDLWLQIDFDDAEFEQAVAGHLLRQFAKRYNPFKGASIKKHC